ncbi:MAG: hypothetical protein LVS60_12975 [Nodosilinea sp. LVE1205-7]
MSRYLLGVLLASLLLTIGSGLTSVSRLFADSSQDSKALNNKSSPGLGSLPIEQAGRLVKRQSQPEASATQAVGAHAESPNTVNGSTSTTPMATNSTEATTLPQPNPTPEGSNNAPVVPTGDISPIQPNLVKPENLRPQNQPLDSIPALW